MPFNRPTLQEIINRTSADAVARLGLEELLRRDDMQVLSRVHAGSSHGLYGYLDWLADQVLPDTADAEILARHADIWGVARKPSSIAAGPVTFAGNNGAVIPAGALLQSIGGLEYETTAEATIAAGTATAQVTALTAGQSGNLAAGAALTLVSPIAGVNAQATVAAGGLVGGADRETDASLLARLKARIQRAPHGGSRDDYVTWALEVAGVTRAWCYPKEQGIGTVVVRFVRDDDASIIPDAAEVAAVQAYIEARYPVAGDVFVVAPIPVALNLTIQLTPNTAAVQAAVQAELTDLLRREAEPGGTILISHIREAISLAAGETNHVLTSPAADVTHTTGQIAVMGAITWV